MPPGYSPSAQRLTLSRRVLGKTVAMKECRPAGDEKIRIRKIWDAMALNFGCGLWAVEGTLPARDFRRPGS